MFFFTEDFRGITEVRQYAVERLEHATDAELQLYLLQLVQALRYEPISEGSILNGAGGPGPEDDVPAGTECSLLSAKQQRTGLKPVGFENGQFLFVRENVSHFVDF